MEEYRKQGIAKAIASEDLKTGDAINLFVDDDGILRCRKANAAEGNAMYGSARTNVNRGDEVVIYS